MGSFSMVHWAVVCLAAMLLFGKGRFSSAMGDIGQGLKSFRKGMTEEEPARVIDSGGEQRPV